MKFKRGDIVKHSEKRLTIVKGFIGPVSGRTYYQVIESSCMLYYEEILSLVEIKEKSHPLTKIFK